MTTNENIGKVLKYYRKLNKLSMDEVTQKLAEHNMHLSNKTDYGWENNQNPPSADKFLLLCDIYKISDINHSFLNKDNKRLKLSSDEVLLLEHYRNMPEMQSAVRKILNMPEPKSV